MRGGHLREVGAKGGSTVGQLLVLLIHQGVPRVRLKAYRNRVFLVGASEFFSCSPNIRHGLSAYKP